MRLVRLAAALGASLQLHTLGRPLGARAAATAPPSSFSSAGLVVEQFRCLRDNYGYLIHDESTGATAAIDTPEVEPILEALDRRGWTLTHILNTHHHADHAGGNAELVRKTGCKVVAPAEEVDKIGHVDVPVRGGDRFELGDAYCMVIDVGGHTKGHVAYHFVDSYFAFVGDSLFALGCGRLFEGTPEQAWASLQRLAALPPETAVYCAHEYTEANLEFALSVDPRNKDLAQRGFDISVLRLAGKPTVPTTIGEELATNPFLRPGDDAIRRTIGVALDATDLEVFATLRKMKDNF